MPHNKLVEEALDISELLLQRAKLVDLLLGKFLIDKLMLYAITVITLDIFVIIVLLQSPVHIKFYGWPKLIYVNPTQMGIKL